MHKSPQGDQASIVGGAIEFVKELEHVVQSLKVKKLPLLQQAASLRTGPNADSTTDLNRKDSAPKLQNSHQMLRTLPLKFVTMQVYLKEQSPDRNPCKSLDPFEENPEAVVKNGLWFPNT